MDFIFQFIGAQGVGTVGIIAAVVLLLSLAVRIISEWERAVILRLGRLVKLKGPGLIFIIPIVDRAIRVPLRTVVYDVPEQEVITNDNVSCKVNAVLYYRVVDPNKAIVNVERFHEATIQLAQTTVRSVVGQAQLDELLSEREKLNKILQQIIDEATDPWGIKVSAVEIKDVVIPNDMQRAIARQAEAERTRRAIIIQAEGEKEASKQLAEAAKILHAEPGAMTLRSLRTASEVAAEQASTLIFPLPIELGQILPLMENLKKSSSDS
ncbi:MAG: slipin family protein [Spirochaetaceae bacterium]|nr:MAG: slipin family protein [Spirochaetaceae bacterium]